MAQKHLHELLREDQEPFLLNNYIADRRCQLNRPISKTHLPIRKPISEPSALTKNFRKNACLFSFIDSPDPKKSPLFAFTSPAKSPCQNQPNSIFLHIPAKTAAMLLEAALRINQKQPNSSKSKSQIKNSGFGLIRSFLKRLTRRNRTRYREIEGNGIRVSVKDILRWDSSVGRRMSEKMMVDSQDKSSSVEKGFSCNCNSTSSVWSESNSNNEERSLNLETASSSSHSDELEETMEFISKDSENGDFASSEKGFCRSPGRFSPQKSPTSGIALPELSSPASSPCRQRKKERDSEGEGLEIFQVQEEDEEKEQCSPVSILDPPFEDDEGLEEEEDDGEDDGVGQEEEDEDNFDLDSSYAIVHRAKLQLLNKLRRFERLAGLDPIELERRMEEEEEEEEEEEAESCQDENESFNKEKNIDGYVRKVLGQTSCFHLLGQIPTYLKRLVSDLIAEEDREVTEHEDGEAVVKRICKRLESWKEVECNTIDMMVALDFKKELDRWKINQEQVRETAVDIEFAIFGLLMEELSQELLICPTDC